MNDSFSASSDIELMYDTVLSDVSFPELPTLIRIDPSQISFRLVFTSTFYDPRPGSNGDLPLLFTSTATTDDDYAFVATSQSYISMFSYDDGGKSPLLAMFAKVNTKEPISAMCIHGDMLAIITEEQGLVSFSLDSFPPLIPDSRKQFDEKFFCLASWDENLITLVRVNKVLMVHIISRIGGITHIPISSVKPEESHDCAISGICVSAEGILYAVDSMQHTVYRVDIKSGDCSSFGGKALVAPVDAVIWMDYLLVLDSENVHIFTPMGVRVKSCSVELPNVPKKINIIGGNILITEHCGKISVFKIET